MAESLNVFDSGAFLVMIQSTKDAGVILLERPKGRVARSSHQAAAEMLPEQRSRRKVPGQQWGRRHGESRVQDAEELWVGSQLASEAAVVQHALSLLGFI